MTNEQLDEIERGYSDKKSVLTEDVHALVKEVRRLQRELVRQKNFFLLEGYDRVAVVLAQMVEARLYAMHNDCELKAGESCLLKTSQEEIGKKCHLYRESVNRVLQQMRRMRWVETSNRRIYVSDKVLLYARSIDLDLEGPA